MRLVKMAAYTKYTYGSVWRKWDLHIHSPNTKLSNNFEAPAGEDVWDKYIHALEKSGTGVIGLTDYFCVDTDGITKLKQAKAEGRLTNLERIFPNIEFRLDQKNKDSEYINVHVL